MKLSTVRKWRVLMIVECCVTESSAPAQRVLLWVQPHFTLTQTVDCHLDGGPLAALDVPCGVETVVCLKATRRADRGCGVTEKYSSCFNLNSL